MTVKDKITLGLGGSCHWCTEAIFASIKGVSNVQQGWLSSEPPNDSYSEGILIEIDTNKINLMDVILIHLETHSSRSQHSKRKKYRSAIYVKSVSDKQKVEKILISLTAKHKQTLITQVLPLKGFKQQPDENYVNYYFKKPDKPFCQTYINPKLKYLLKNHSNHVDPSRLSIINEQPGLSNLNEPNINK